MKKPLATNGGPFRSDNDGNEQANPAEEKDRLTNAIYHEPASIALGRGTLRGGEAAASQTCGRRDL
jgi:hypothetical protein